ncbi:Exodeoxyribonuclease VII large subunit [hydrothermal vent metagenome]|uniref:Exodeoxyribonuclease VII large subunit n=1 Tax=hydrothermal vent metagenome TaxID=652676 RepID=A0A3B0U9A6_9ZZZZ
MNEPKSQSRQGEEPQTNAHEYSVSGISRALKSLIEDQFGHVRVRGEVGRLTRPGSGHVYFDLKDEKSTISAVAWKGVAARWRFQPEQGLEVIVTGRLTTFAGQSKYQIIVENVEPAGVGALMALLEARRKKLAAEGLFDEQYKQKLPYLPKTIGVVTSPTGAVIRDILHRLADRFPTNVLVWPVRVQGESCAPEVAAAIEGFNMLPENGEITRPDLIIVARGGGSVEDLWGFNEEIVVRAIAESAIPTISAIGHETDMTLADFAADKRAPTPTGAAEIAVPVRRELVAYIDDLGMRQRTGARRIMASGRDRLLAVSAGLPRPGELVGEAKQHLDLVQARLGAALGKARQIKALQLAKTAPRLSAAVLIKATRERWRRLNEISLRAPLALTNVKNRAELKYLPVSRRLGPAFKRQLAEKNQRLEQLWQLANSLGYPNVLKRGFVLVSDNKGALVRSAGALKPAERVIMQFADGKVGAIVQGKEEPDAAPRPAKKQRKSSTPPDDGQTSLF